MAESDPKLQIEKLSPRKGDVLLVKAPGPLTPEAWHSVATTVAIVARKTQCRFMVLEDNIEVELLSPREGDVLLVKTPAGLPHGEGAVASLVKQLQPILKKAKCTALVWEDGPDVRMFDGEAIMEAVAHLEIVAGFLDKGQGERDWGCVKGPAMAERYRQTAETIRAWLIPKDGT